MERHDVLPPDRDRGHGSLVASRREKHYGRAKRAGTVKNSCALILARVRPPMVQLSDLTSA